MSVLSDAVNAFNEKFDYDLRLPANPEDICTAADLAELRGQQAIADDLRIALKTTLETDE
jgi:hypothetical protein